MSSQEKQPEQQQVEMRGAHELRAGNSVMYLFEDGRRRPRLVKMVRDDGDYIKVEYDDGGSSTFGPLDRVRVATEEAPSE